jgi:hypothetical protein
MKLDLSPAQRQALAYIHADEGRSGAVVVGNAAAPLPTVFALGRAGLVTLEKSTWTPRGGFRLRVQYEAKLTSAGRIAFEASRGRRGGGGGARSGPIVVRLRVSKSHIEAEPLSLAEAQDLFGPSRVSESWGTVRIEGVSLGAVQRALREAGYRTSRTT